MILLTSKGEKSLHAKPLNLLDGLFHKFGPDTLSSTRMHHNIKDFCRSTLAQSPNKVVNLISGDYSHWGVFVAAGEIGTLVIRGASLIAPLGQRGGL